jgi:hypothetical protein
LRILDRGQQTPTYREKVADSKLYVVNQKSCQFERDALEVLIHSVEDVRDLLVIEFFLR